MNRVDESHSTTDPTELFEAGKAALLAKEFETARRILTPLAEAGTPPAARFFLARCAFLQDDLGTARHWLAMVREKQPKHAGALVLEGRLALADGQFDAAEESIDKALELNPDLPAALTAKGEVTAARSAAVALAHIATVDDGYLEARTDGPNETMIEAVQALAALPPGPTWTSDPVQAKIAFFHHAKDPVAALRNYDPHLIKVSCELDYITWPRRIQELVKHQKVLDVGCGFGGYGMGFLVAGAVSYAGLDPVMDLDSTRAKNKRTRTWSDMGVTPRDVMEELPAIRLYQGTAESITFTETFDTIALHNVTEHLIQLDQVFEGLVPLCTPTTQIVYLHHNFYCWNGHHFAPNQPHQYDPENPKHQEVVDWGHIDFAQDLPEDHYFATRLNRVTLAEIREITDRHFHVDIWDQRPSSKATLDRMTPEIRARIAGIRPDLTDADLSTNVVYCVARRRPD